MDREFSGVSVTFGSDLLGVIVRDLQLDATRNTLGSPGTAYSTITNIG